MQNTRDYKLNAGARKKKRDVKNRATSSNAAPYPYDVEVPTEQQKEVLVRHAEFNKRRGIISKTKSSSFKVLLEKVPAYKCFDTVIKNQLYSQVYSLNNFIISFIRCWLIFF